MPVTHPWAPSEAGFATSLARPGGNITGVTGYYLEIWGKRLQILKEAVPSAFKAAFLAIRGLLQQTVTRRPCKCAQRGKFAPDSLL